MCKDEVPPSPQLVPVSDIVKAAPQRLTSCKTACELIALKPDIGAVTVGGNVVGPQYCLADSDSRNLKAVDKASYVARVCFVGSSRGAKWSDTLCLGHGATVEDLKRSFFERHKSHAIAAAISASGLQGATEQEQLASIFCLDVSGGFLADNYKLPAANTCSDVGCHGLFFLDVKPSSMRRTTVKKGINASDTAIDSFVNTPFRLGAATLPQEHPNGWVAVRQELHERLQTVTREVPLAIRPDALENASAVFGLLLIRDDLDDEDKVCGSNMPLAYSRCASELADAIKSKSIDSLEDTLPEEAASHLMAMHPYVEELARVQKTSEWTNFNTETDHEDGLALCDIASELYGAESRRESVKRHVSMKD
jgi:hypothetical protein